MIFRLPSIACSRCGFTAGEALELPAVPSVLKELLSSNTAPEDSIYDDLRREVEVAEKNLPMIEENINHLERMLQQLTARRQELRDFVADHHKIMAPIRKLPNELLWEIFSHGEGDSLNRWNLIDTRWLLPQVCRSWRAVALSMPRLWNHLSFNDPIMFGHLSHRGVRAMLLLQLERSAEAPLTIDLSRGDLGETEKRLIFEVLLPVAHRWQDFNLRLDFRNVPYFLIHGVVSFPQLTKLSLSVNNPECPFSSIFMSMPLLKELRYDAPPDSHWDSESSLSQLNSLPLSQIKKLHLSHQWSRVSDMLNILRAASNIVEASFHYCHMRQEPLVNPVTVPNLVSLDIRENVGTFLDYIVAPALRRLTLKFPPSSGISPDAMSFIARTGSVLTHLTFHCLLKFDNMLLDFLGHTPHISNLVLGRSQSYIESDFVKALTCGPGEPNLVPELVFLELRGYFRCGGVLLFDMLKSRCTPGPLRSLRLEDCGSDLPDYIHIIPRDFGLDVIRL
ncbi:hypothetical protein B0H13DRAFT_1024821 [Mycena leptocephala]|nr:hypothetical protein B0H13DRAFT_1024821 [Mycena leptocephala]